MGIGIELVDWESSKAANEIYLGHFVPETFNANYLEANFVLSWQFADEGYSPWLWVFGYRDDDILDIFWAGFDGHLALGGVLGIAVEISVLLFLEIDGVYDHLSEVLIAGVAWTIHGFRTASHFNEAVSLVVDSEFACVFWFVDGDLWGLRVSFPYGEYIFLMRVFSAHDGWLFSAFFGGWLHIYQSIINTYYSSRVISQALYNRNKSNMSKYTRNISIKSFTEDIRANILKLFWIFWSIDKYSKTI